jgi:hypothetical protein
MHARIVDRDDSRHTVEQLRQWKADAEAAALRQLGRPRLLIEDLPARMQQVNAAVLIQGPNAINISGPNAVVLGPNAISIHGPVVHNSRDQRPE